MSIDKKLPLAEPGRHFQPESTVRRPKIASWVSFGAFIVGALVLSWRHSSRSIIPPADVEFAPLQCPQVEGLTPTHSSPALAEMEAFLASDKFKSESIERLSGAIQIPSESYDDMGPIGEDPRWDVMYDMAAYLEKSFPAVYSTLKVEKVNTHGLLYTWQGSDETLKPTLMMAHQDVVPVAASTVDQWTFPPYSGHYDGKNIWGRGAADCKNNLIGIMEALELLVLAEFKPKRTVIVAFGFDEEISGAEGAGHLAPVVLDRYGKYGIAAIVDEGAGIAPVFGGVLGLPAVGEKGYIDVEIIVRMPGGHSSVPPRHTGIGVMAELITGIEADPYRPHLHEENPFLGLLTCAAVHCPDFPSDVKKLLERRDPSGSNNPDKLAEATAELGDIIKYMFTTSVAVDVIEGGVKVNALPERTRILVNHRVNVGDHTSDVKDKMTKIASTVAAKYNLTLHAFDGEPESPSSITLVARPDILEPAPVTPTNVDVTTPYAILSGTTRALYGDKVFMSPGFGGGNTDTRFSWDLTKHIFRWDPGYDADRDDREEGAHTVDEWVSVKAHTNGVQWYTLFLRNMDEAVLE